MDLNNRKEKVNEILDGLEVISETDPEKAEEILWRLIALLPTKNVN